jgi:hypothetical protein
VFELWQMALVFSYHAASFFWEFQTLPAQVCSDRFTEHHFLYITFQTGGTELSTQLSSKKAVFSSFCRKPKVFEVGFGSIFPILDFQFILW